MNSFLSGWYVIYTRPKHEKKVYARLTQRSIISFLPTKRTLRTWHDRKKYVDEPLFPSYIFVFLNDLQSYYIGMDVEGTLYYIKTGNQIARVSESVIENIRLVTKHAHEVEITDRQFYPGQKAVISKGALTGLACELVEVERRKMLWKS
jgi:transcriptional antiterminator RfaH